jgi:hypothetical protein
MVNTPNGTIQFVRTPEDAPTELNPDPRGSIDGLGFSASAVKLRHDAVAHSSRCDGDDAFSRRGVECMHSKYEIGLYVEQTIRLAENV